MKVIINGYQIECTPQEFLELTREMGNSGIAEKQVLPDDYKPLTDDYKKWIEPKPNTMVALYGCQIPGPVTYGDGSTAIYTGETSLSDNMFKLDTEADARREDRREYYKRKKALREAPRRPKDFPPYLDLPKE